MKKDETIENMDRNLKSEGFEKYIPLLDMLYENRDKLSKLLLANGSGNIPKYIIPGAAKTKSIYMNDRLSRLMADFASNNGINQREIVEAGIILYMQKFGGSYKKDIELLLNQT